jgi:hypothetical protein
LILEIINQAAKQGFILDDADAKRLISCVDPVWFEDPSFIEFVATEKIFKDKNYGGKPQDEQRRLFRKLLLDAPNIRLEYPIWLENQKQEAAETALRVAREQEEAEKQAKIQEAMEAEPKFCECGEPLDETLSCLKCKVSYEFDECSLEYRPKPMSAFVIEYALKKRKEKRGPGS